MPSTRIAPASELMYRNIMRVCMPYRSRFLTAHVGEDIELQTSVRHGGWHRNQHPSEYQDLSIAHDTKPSRGPCHPLSQYSIAQSALTSGAHCVNSRYQLGAVDSGTTTKKGPRLAVCLSQDRKAMVCRGLRVRGGCTGCDLQVLGSPAVVC